METTPMAEYIVEDGKLTADGVTYNLSDFRSVQIKESNGVTALTRTYIGLSAIVGVGIGSLMDSHLATGILSIPFIFLVQFYVQQKNLDIVVGTATGEKTVKRFTQNWAGDGKELKASADRMVEAMAAYSE
jgi:hypothetical protein